MAGVYSIYSVGDSLITFLRNTYPEPLRSEYPCEFRLVSSGELSETEDFGTAVTLYLYRVENDAATRNMPYSRGGKDLENPLSLALHYLLVIWGDSALAEHTIAAWTMLQLHQHPIFDKSNLSSSGDWDPGDRIHIVPMEMSNEDLMRLWDVITPNYRISLPYVARVVRIDPDRIEAGRPVVATQYGYGEIITPDETD